MTLVANDSGSGGGGGQSSKVRTTKTSNSNMVNLCQERKGWAQKRDTGGKWLGKGTLRRLLESSEIVCETGQPPLPHPLCSVLSMRKVSN